LDRRAGAATARRSTTEDWIQQTALEVIQQRWPGVSALELGSGRNETGNVWARWLFAHLLYREARLPKRHVADTVAWRSTSTLAAAMKALDSDVATNRVRAREFNEVVTRFRELVEKASPK
jgi:hypothetical protein